jgi:hypothetical protein
MCCSNDDAQYTRAYVHFVDDHFRLFQKDAKDQSKIVVTGFEDACQMAVWCRLGWHAVARIMAHRRCCRPLLHQRDRILRLIKEAEEQEQQDGDMATETLTIDPQLHGRIIGARGKQVAKLSEDLSVQIKFPKVRDIRSVRMVVCALLGVHASPSGCVGYLSYLPLRRHICV